MAMPLLLLPLLAPVLAPEIAVEVPVFVVAPFPAQSLERALGEVDDLFAESGIRWRWRVSSGGGAPGPASLVAVVVASRPEHPVISGCSRSLHDHRLGITQLRERRITLWAEQVARAVGGDWDRDEPPAVDERVLSPALGRVLAHELGHLFLRLDGHRKNGLMRASFSHRALAGRSDRSFRLSGDDVERVRSAILHLRVESPAVSPSSGASSPSPASESRHRGNGPERQ
jgi:hypothetical protein